MGSETNLEEYFTLFFDPNSIRQEDAMKLKELKRKFLPESLFRFRSLDDKESLDRRLKEIEQGEIWLTTPEEQNDPFECLFAFDREKIRNHLKEIGRKKSIENNPDIDLATLEDELANREKIGDKVINSELPDIMEKSEFD